MLKQRLSMGVVLLTAMFAAANCENGDTVVALNVSYDSTAMDVQSKAASLHVTISPKAGGGPANADIELMRDNDGGITTPSYKRITVNGMSGMVDITVDARDSGGSTLLSASTTAELSQHSAVAAFVKFARMAPTPDASAGDDTGSKGSGGSVGSGGASGSGGATGSGGSASDGG